MRSSTRHKTRRRTVHFTTNMDLCHLKNSELDEKFQKYKDRVVLRGTVFVCNTNDGRESSGCNRQSIWMCCSSNRRSIRLHPMEDDPVLLKLPKSECSDTWQRLPRYRWPKDGRTLKNQWCPWRGICTDISLAGLLWERQFENVLLQELRAQSTNLGMFVRSSPTRTFDPTESSALWVLILQCLDPSPGSSGRIPCESVPGQDAWPVDCRLLTWW